VWLLNTEMGNASNQTFGFYQSVYHLSLLLFFVGLALRIHWKFG